jgi:hypothetical protein
LSEHVDGFREVDGVYAGRSETSFLVWLKPGHILEGIDELTALGSEFNQSTVLVVHCDNAAELVECDTECSAIIGTFQRVEDVTPGEDCSIVDGAVYVVR